MTDLPCRWKETRYFLRIAPINDALVCLEGCKAYTKKKHTQFFLEYIVTIHFVCPYLNLLTLYVHYTKTLAVKKWFTFELICAVYFKYIVTIHFVCPYQNLLTLFIVMWLPFELICAVYLEYIVAIHFVCPYPNLLTLYVQWYISWTDLLCSANQESSHQKVAVQVAYFLSLCVQYT